MAGEPTLRQKGDMGTGEGVTGRGERGLGVS